MVVNQPSPIKPDLIPGVIKKFLKKHNTVVMYCAFILPESISAFPAQML